MKDRIRLKVLGISYSQIHSGANALIMAQVDGPIRIPIVIGNAEAQSIAIRMEGITPPRPLTHDLFVSFTHAFGVTLKEVFIYKFENGIFSSELTFSDGERQVVLDSRTSDAIAIAMRTKAPIYTTRAIMEETGFVMDMPSTDSTSEDDNDDNLTSLEPKLENYAIEELERTLAKLVDDEQYEKAARVQALINFKRQQKNNGNGDGSPTE